MWKPPGSITCRCCARMKPEVWGCLGAAMHVTSVYITTAQRLTRSGSLRLQYWSCIQNAAGEWLKRRWVRKFNPFKGPDPLKLEAGVRWGIKRFLTPESGLNTRSLSLKSEKWNIWFPVQSDSSIGSSPGWLLFTTCCTIDIFAAGNMVFKMSTM